MSFAPARPLVRTTLLALAAAALVLCIATAPAAAAENHLVLKQTRGAFMGNPPAENTIEYWIGKDRVRRQDPNGTFILRLDRKKAYRLDVAAKTYNEFDLPIDLKKLLADHPDSQVKRILEMPMMTARVTPTDETKTVAGVSARRFNVDLINPMGVAVLMVTWASKDLGVDLKTYEAFGRAMQSLAPGMSAVTDEMAKVEGFPVLNETTMSMMGQEVVTTEMLVSHEKKAAPAGAFEIPEGFTKVAFNPLRGGGRR